MKIEIPTNCPACDSILEVVGDRNELFCLNVDCPARKSRSVQHFCKVLKIKGFGPATIERLGISSINELYELTYDDIAAIMGHKLADRLNKSLEKAHCVDFADLMAAFGIPGLGISRARDLARVVSSIYDIDEDACKAAGLGPVATQNVLEWIEEGFATELSKLPITIREGTSREEPVESKGVVCISGRLKSFKTKAQAKKELEAHGYTVKDSLTKEVTILINESGIQSTKTQNAEKRGVCIVEDTRSLL